MTTASRPRSVLFAPASRPDVLRKLPRSGPDAVVLDLEDAVPPDAKDDARVHAREVGDELAAAHPALGVFVRVNCVHTPWFLDDVRGALGPGLTGVVVPKVESVDDLDAVARELDSVGRSDVVVVAGIETAAGVARVEGLLRAPVSIAYFGAEDFIADMGGVRTIDGGEVLYARSRVALAARMATVHALDQVVPSFSDDERFVTDGRQGRAIGFGGKLCIHPSQVRLANEIFSPSPDELERARRLLDAYEQARAAGEAAISFEGEMVDEPMARRARAVLELGSPPAGRRRNG